MGIDNVKSDEIEHIRVYIHSIEERGMFEICAAKTPVNYPERRDVFGKPESKTTIANYISDINAFYSQHSFEGFEER